MKILIHYMTKGKTNAILTKKQLYILAYNCFTISTTSIRGGYIIGGVSNCSSDKCRFDRDNTRNNNHLKNYPSTGCVKTKELKDIEISGVTTTP